MAAGQRIAPEAGFLIPRKPIPKLDDQIHPISESKRGLSSSSSQLDHRVGSSPLPQWMQDWWLEGLCCFLFVGALLGVIGVVLPYQDQPLPHWPYSLSINTLISILVAVSKSAMLLVIAEGLSQLKWTWFCRERPLMDMARFDRASRGPLGSLRLLFSLRGRSLAATLGTLIMISSIAVDPFAQQIVRYSPCTISAPSLQATLPRTNSYSEVGPKMYAGVGVMPAKVQESINAGIYTPGSTRVTGYRCASGNCTFSEPYHTLGICSSCVDKTPDLKITYTNMTNESNAAWNYSLPSGLYSYILEDTIGAVGNFSLATMGPSDSDDSIIGIIMNPWPEYLEYYTRQRSPGCEASENKSFGCNGVGAAECSLDICVKTYNGTINNGLVTERLLSQWSDLSVRGDGISALNVNCLDRATREAVIAQGYKIPPGANWLAYNATPAMPTLARVAPARCIYSFSTYTVSSLVTFLSSFLSGQYLVPTGSEDQPAATSSAMGVIVQTIYGNTDEFYGEQEGSFERLTGVFASVAEPLTIHIRETGDMNYSVPVTGNVDHETTCVHVYWGWLLFPLALTALTVVFFIVTVLQTGVGRDRFHGWKSSPLALLYHGLDQNSQPSHPTYSTSMTDMVEDSEVVRVQLRRTEKGWKLVGTLL